MESYQNQSGAQQTHQQLDQFGNPFPATTGAYGTAGGAPVMAEGGGLSGMLHRSGSSSSSSSEDDGLGGRRRKKKGITEKIKEKLTGHHESNKTSLGSTTTAYDTGTVHHEKKGMMEKIKEKLPGGHH
ncbi:Dehydrin [Arabidopsis thaliana x Arabidopsis arenosa]|uniref:Dehydrin n=1 Tax=Arabidopsis thaliana x Arabidopsis arenosa TaxID=1240361 RepID=A0A8T1ZQC2_9BRAS|nr:Dehydrin [Arabidopsis thaliana x Arabidopsis arenosa]